MPLIEPRKKAPTFTLKDQSRKKRSLKDYEGRIVVLHFFPKTSGATGTNEAAQFRDHHIEFRKVKAAVVGVCPESPEQLAMFTQAHALPYSILADEPNGDGVPSVCEQYGAWQPRVAAATRYLGVVRTTYLIDQDGKVARRWDAVRVQGHAAEVLDAVRRLHAGERLQTPDGDEVALNKAKSRKQSRQHDTDPQFTPVRGAGNRSSRGPQARTMRPGEGKRTKGTIHSPNRSRGSVKVAPGRF
jgi:peroxiredoxin Q/BCP